MRCQLFLVSLCLTLLSAAHVVAGETKFRSQSQNMKLWCKGQKTPSLNANGFDDTPTFIGDTNSPFIPITFPNDLFVQGKGIQAETNGFEFTLDKGVYQVVFTEIFEAIDFGNSDNIIYQIAIKLGSKVHTPFVDSLFSENETSFSKMIRVNKKSKLSIVARNISPGTNMVGANRSLQIIRQGD